MSERRETTLNDSELARSPATKREDLPLTEVLAHRGHHHHDRREGIRGRGIPVLAGSVELLRVLVEALARRQEQGGIGQHLTELALPVAVQVCRRPCAAESLGKRPPERALGQVEEIARLLELRAVGEREIEGNRALGVFGRARARVEDHVVLGERRRSGDDPLDPLVVGIAFDPAGLHPGEQRPDLARPSAPERLEVEVLGFGELVIAARELVELLREPRELVGVLAQETLDAGKLHGRRGHGLGRGARARAGAGRRLVVAPATREPENEQEQQPQRRQSNAIPTPVHSKLPSSSDSGRRGG